MTAYEWRLFRLWLGPLAVLMLTALLVIGNLT